MEDGKRKPDAEASSSTNSKRQRTSDERESGSPHLDAPEKINEPSESEANSEPPASYADVRGNNYYVFLSFRGPDTRKGFVDHLYHELVRVGLYHPNFVFRDDEGLDFGERIDESILSAIKLSKVSIPVISQKFAASKWCLREIIQIMECVKSGQKVYPVLYNVTTDDVKGMKGDFGKAFEDAFRNPKNESDEELKREGPVALRKALDHKVFESDKFANGYEGKLVKAVAEKIMRELQRDFPPSLPMDLVGIDDHVAKVMKLANTTSSETQIIVIYGIGGIGKTTLATAIYKKLSNKFENKFDCRSFLKDIRETIKGKGMKHVQSLHISNLTNSGHNEHDCGIETIQDICKSKKVLIFLDDVDRRDHLDNLFGGCDFKSGSWIIITCRDEALFKSEYKGYKLEEMNHMNSLILLSRYAFKDKKPPPELEDLSNDIVVTTGGLPLALVIIGSFLKGKSPSIWIETREKLRKVPHMDVQQKLMISYDSLEYEEQQMFLDIACFFIGTNKIFAAYLWKDLQHYVESGLERMIELSLMKIDGNDEFIMHDQLRDLGRAIACPAQKKLWKCSRLWDEKAIIVQRSKDENRNIEVLRLDENGSNMFMNLRSFERMPYLKFLRLSKVNFVGNFENSLSELRWLEWEKCPNHFGVTNLHLEKLLILDLSYGYISHEWRGWSSIKMERLKVLNLSHCIELVRTPNLSAFKSLEMLILKNCKKLEEIDPSIGHVKCLTSLNLSNCWSLREFWGFNRIPNSIGELRSLTELHLTCANILELPDSIGKLKSLKILKIAGCRKLSRLPTTISRLSKLEELDAAACEFLEGAVPINGLSSLKILRLGKLGRIGNLWEKHKGSDDLSLEDFSNLSSRQHLDLTNCDLPASLTVLEITSHNRRLPRLSHLSDLKELTFQFCESLESIPELPLGILDLWVFWCVGLKELPSLSNLGLLSNLHIMGCGELMEIEGLEGLKSLRDLSICGCTNLLNLNGLKHLESLRELQIRELDASIMNDHEFQVQCLGRLENLETLRIIYCKSLTRLDISQLTRLELLLVSQCEDVVEIKGLEGLKNLRGLTIKWCDSIETLPPRSLFDNLKYPRIVGCPKLRDVQDWRY